MKILKNVGLSIVSILLFLLIWNMASSALYNRAVETTIAKIEKSQSKEAAKETRKRIESGDPSSQPNSLPSPLLVWNTAGLLIDDAQQVMQKKRDFYKKMEKTNAKLKAQNKEPITYTGRPSFLDQILTSLENIFWGVILAISIAIPFGILMGLSKGFKTSVNWFVQVFKPISPVVWFLLVQMIVNTMMTDPNGDNAFVITFISVGLCAMWATLVNTSVGVSSVDESYLNVSKVLRLGIGKKIFKVVLPASIPLIFTGLRITVSVAWMVLIAVEWLSQSPGLGGFVREEFQNGSSSSNAKIMVAMFVIGIIGFVLDKAMAGIQGLVSFENQSQAPSPLTVVRNLFVSKKAA
ncbi:MAG: ABC transporter permease subunit [Bacteroidota bacterium]